MLQKAERYVEMRFWNGSRPFSITQPIRLIELFGGIGSQAAALKNIGADFEHYRLVEIDRFSVRSYNAIHGTKFQTSDIRKTAAADLQIIDTKTYCYIMTYSFPCQDLSPAGYGKGMERNSGTRSSLLFEVERLLRGYAELPQILIMENVPSIMNYKNIGPFAEWLDFLERCGYKNYYKLLNTKDFGTPQDRKRCFMVSLYGDYYYDFPAPELLRICVRDILDSVVDKKYYLSAKQIASRLNSGFKQQRMSIIYADGICRTLQALEANRVTAVCLNPTIKIDNVDSSKILWFYKVGIYDPDSAVAYLTGKTRKLTPHECWRLMGFSNEQFYRAKAAGISETQLYKQAGDSIGVLVLEKIFNNLF